MPLLRAMTPVRIECGDHFGASVSGPAAASLGSAVAADAPAATAVRIPRAKSGCKDNGRCPAGVQSLSSMTDWTNVVTVVGGLSFHFNNETM